MLAILQRVASMMQADDLEVEPFLFHESSSAESAIPPGSAESREVFPGGSEAPGIPGLSDGMVRG